MIKFSSMDESFVTFYRTQDFNSLDGEMSIEVQQVEPGSWRYDVDAKILELENQVNRLVEADLAEVELRKNNPALQDLYNQYKSVQKLVQDTDGKKNAEHT